MENSPQNLLDEYAGEKLQQARRRKLLPVWIRIFVWIFTIMGGFAIPILIIGLMGTNVDLALYGLETNEVTSAEGLLLIALFLYKGIVAALLWFERGPAAVLGILDAVLGILICIWVMFAAPKLAFRLELVALIPYLIAMIRISKKW